MELHCFDLFWISCTTCSYTAMQKLAKVRLFVKTTSCIPNKTKKGTKHPAICYAQSAFSMSAMISGRHVRFSLSNVESYRTLSMRDLLQYLNKRWLLSNTLLMTFCLSAGQCIWHNKLCVTVSSISNVYVTLRFCCVYVICI